MNEPFLEIPNSSYQALSNSDLQWLNSRGQQVYINLGDTMWRRGDPIDGLYFVKSGKLTADPIATNGLFPQKFEVLPGDVLGVNALLRDGLSNATVRGLETSRLIKVPRSDLDAKLRNDPAFAAHFWRFVSHQLVKRARFPNYLPMMINDSSRDRGAGEKANIDTQHDDLLQAKNAYISLGLSVDPICVQDVLLKNMAQAVFLVDEDRQIIHRNPAAIQLSASQDIIKIDTGFLALRDPTDDLKLGTYIRQLLSRNGADLAYQQPRFLMRAGRHGSSNDVVVSGMLVEPTGLAKLGMMDQHVIITIHPIRHKTDFDPALIGKLFRLTSAESQVAVLLAQGSSAETIAHSRRVSLHTIRTQIKSVYGKTQVKRQAELALLMSSFPHPDRRTDQRP